MENKTKQDIKVLREDVDHIKQSFYADLEAYYGNTKLVDDFQALTRWSGGIADTTNFKIGKQSIKLIETDNVGSGIETIKNNISLDLTKLNNGEVSVDDDYILLVCYISDVSKIDNLSIIFDQASSFTGSNVKIRDFIILDLVTGWNFLKIKKSSFRTAGTGSWSNIQSMRLKWVSVTNSQNAYVSFQLIQLVKKDPVSLIEMPNPFQKFGVRDFEIVNGEWFVGKDNSELILMELSSQNYSINSLSSTTKFHDFIISGRLKASHTSLFGFSTAYKDANNNIQIELSTNLLKLRVYENAILTTFSIPAEIVAGDIIFYTFEKKGAFLDLKVYKNRDLTPTYMVKGNTNLNGLSLSISHGSQYTGKISSTSITEISHAHHADVAEVTKRLSVHPYSNPNLLINGDFQVWQRGMSFPLSLAYTYTADRWRAQKGVTASGNVTKHYNSLRVEATGDPLILRQYVEGNFLGKVLTLSIKVNGEIMTCTGSVKMAVPVVTKRSDDGIVSAYFIEENGFLVAGVNIYVGVAVIDWIKLELGEIATPLSPRSYGEELALCQRYYRKITGTIFPSYITNDKRSIIFDFSSMVQNMRENRTFLNLTAHITFTMYNIYGVNTTSWGGVYNVVQDQNGIVVSKNVDMATPIEAVGAMYSFAIDAEIY